ncbi:unnamed protein product, partial [Symbiodinium microadriaticum]
VREAYTRSNDALKLKPLGWSLEVREQEFWNERERSLNEQRLMAEVEVERPKPRTSPGSTCMPLDDEKSQASGDEAWDEPSALEAPTRQDMGTPVATPRHGCAGTSPLYETPLSVFCKWPPRPPKRRQSFCSTQAPDDEHGDQEVEDEECRRDVSPGREAGFENFLVWAASCPESVWMYLDVFHFLSVDAQDEEQHVDDGQVELLNRLLGSYPGSEAKQMWALAKPEDAEQRMCTDGAMMSIFAGESERPALNMAKEKTELMQHARQMARTERLPYLNVAWLRASGSAVRKMLPSFFLRLWSLQVEDHWSSQEFAAKSRVTWQCWNCPKSSCKLDQQLAARVKTVQQVQKKKIALDDDMMKAAWLGKRDVVSRLLEQKADIRYQEPVAGRTALHYAAKHGGAKTVSLLLMKQADIHLKDQAGKTPLHVAVENFAVGRGHSGTEMVHMLLKGRADVNARNDKGQTALQVAREMRVESLDPAVVRMLKSLEEDLAQHPSE